MAEVHEIADGIFRIATFIPEANITFNQFLIADEKPLLFHTGQRLLFPLTLEAVRQVIDPTRLRYISWSHLEADESGALNEFLQVAPQAEAVHSELGVVVNVNDFAIRPAKVMGDGEVLDLGQHKLRFMITPQVPHCWDAILAFEETTGTLMASDLFTQLGEKASMTSGDMVERTMASHKQLPTYIPVSQHTARVFDRLEALRPGVLACMHGPAFSGDAVQALRDLRTALFSAPEEELTRIGGPVTSTGAG
jgi:flavorubredoxin